MVWELNIKRVENGFVVINYNEDEGGVVEREYVFEQKDNELEAMVDVLNFIQDHFGYYGSKHDKERIFVEIKKQK